MPEPIEMMGRTYIDVTDCVGMVLISQFPDEQPEIDGVRALCAESWVNGLTDREMIAALHYAIGRHRKNLAEAEEAHSDAESDAIVLALHRPATDAPTAP